MIPAHSRFDDQDTQELPRELIDLGKRIEKLPLAFQKQLDPHYEQVLDCVRRRRRILNLVQEALAQLRLDIKYLMFDLESTRTERDQLRAKLDELDS